MNFLFKWSRNLTKINDDLTKNSDKLAKINDKLENKCYTNDRKMNHHTEGGINMNFSALDVAKYVISERNKVRNPISNLELQKTLYYIQGYFLKVFGEDLFVENIINWRYGPVVVETYFRYNQFTHNGINIDYDETQMGNFGVFIFGNTNQNQKKLIDNIIEKCTKYSARQLVYMTHSEEPWRNTVKDELISIESVENFFIGHDPLSLGGAR